MISQEEHKYKEYIANTKFKEQRASFQYKQNKILIGFMFSQLCLAVFILALIINGIHRENQLVNSYRDAQQQRLKNELYEINQQSSQDITKPWIIMDLNDLEKHPNEIKIRYLIVKTLMQKQSNLQLVDTRDVPDFTIENPNNNTQDTPKPIFMATHQNDKLLTKPIQYQIIITEATTHLDFKQKYEHTNIQEIIDTLNGHRIEIKLSESVRFQGIDDSTIENDNNTLGVLTKTQNSTLKKDTDSIWFLIGISLIIISMSFIYAVYQGMDKTKKMIKHLDDELEDYESKLEELRCQIKS